MQLWRGGGANATFIFFFIMGCMCLFIYCLHCRDLLFIVLLLVDIKLLCNPTIIMLDFALFLLKI